MVMVGVQSLPYLATVVTAAISALSYRSRRPTPVTVATPPVPEPEPALPKAA
jgi:hypothetical protein